MPTTIRIPMTLLTVQPDTANAYYITTTGTNLDYSYIQFADSALGIATYWTTIPQNLAATPSWNLDIHHHAATGSGGNVAISAFGRVLSNNTIDVALTLLTSANVLSTNTSGIWTLTALSGGNFDSVLAISSLTYLIVEIDRHGNIAGDTVNAAWNLSAVTLKTDIT